ncbi:restriction endonuclease subunit S [Methylomarinum sp. Ch1-1]|uniref:Restriction endonuclease subunit S n=1 Tax=Methylomarinum roseum TaxID=3067653 RepID=A0AAU7NUL3_9GAMM|nr:restriction endonuclease subunit S [Methylomarinum sp. Ch1-1]MDP4519257.1 restriction endonuclease subunit S [Methylomarinum sp. Ch1-1]
MAEVKLPKSWIVSDLNSILLCIVGGGTPSKSNLSYYQGNIPWMSVKDMNKNILVDTIDHISQEAVDNSSTNVIPAGTPIIATRMSLGKIVMAKFDSAINQDLKALFPSASTSSDYLVYWYRSITRQIEQLGTGTTVKGIRLENIKALEFPVAPLAEQKVIADKLDILLAQVESSKARLERIPKILKRFRQSVLADAVSGKLTEEWREAQNHYPNLVDELHRVADSVVANAPTNAQKIKLSKVYSEIEKPILLTVNVPKNWIICNLAKLCEPFSYGTSAKSKSDGEIPVLRMGNLQNGQLDWSNLVYTSDKQEIEKYKLSSGDVLFNRTNSPELVGKTAIYKGERKAIYAGYLIKARCLELLLPDYLNYALNSFYGKDYCRQVKSDGVSQSNINAQKLGAFVLPLPSTEEQTEIVNRVEQLFAYADTIEQQVQNALMRVNKLSQSILAKAFRGELTEQWRQENPDLISGDNSAEALLAKIKAEREAMQPTKKKTRARKVTA